MFWCFQWNNEYYFQSYCHIWKNPKLNSITTAHKPNKPKDEITSYKTVSVSKNFMKVFEALIFNNLNSFIVSNYVIPDS